MLYLRSFKEDPHRGTPETHRALPLLDLTPPGVIHTLLTAGKSAEDHLASCFRDMGPVIAVGQPGERLPPAVGARRLYLEQGPWKNQVRDLISRARFVVLVADDTEGTLWEFAEATRLVPPERFLLVVPASEKAYEAFRRKATVLPRGDAARTGRDRTVPRLPVDPRIDSDRIGMALPHGFPFGGVVSYSPDREPVFTPLRVTPPALGMGLVGPTLWRTVRPAVERALDAEAVILKAHHDELYRTRKDLVFARRMHAVMLAGPFAFLAYLLIRWKWAAGEGLDGLSPEWWVSLISAVVLCGYRTYRHGVMRRTGVLPMPPSDGPGTTR
ncbi:hypothetical protein [Saccharothrix violaceirubra]|uniref:Uncharacterized protein n=1 Tax=Saccharothrix violaceirubra TaxID=413306 RepID=A0A7W7T420_9PSEU|nr:hypothetical protein [Saccharothrix violaceirubra]MBB4966141.1 hypothetical protein [Saccharothrix violaceirubra]